LPLRAIFVVIDICTPGFEGVRVAGSFGTYPLLQPLPSVHRGQYAIDGGLFKGG